MNCSKYFPCWLKWLIVYVRVYWHDFWSWAQEADVAFRLDEPASKVEKVETVEKE